jgi:hypothetical protein
MHKISQLPNHPTRIRTVRHGEGEGVESGICLFLPGFLEKK